ncbi:OB-fold-containig protein, partial [Acinetobacter baumannii]
MADFFFNYYLMPFHLSVVALILLSVVETIGMYVGKIAPIWLTNSPLLNVKFSKALIFVFLLINFSFAGYFLQLSFFAIQHYFITPFYLIIPALVIAIFFTVFMIHCLDQVIKPKLTHTNYNLLGRLATISSGSARPGFSAQARVRDEFGQLH